MCDKSLLREMISQILEAIHRIERRFSGITNPNDFVSSDQGIDKLDAICMMLLAIGESCKKIDKITDGILFGKFPEIDWKGVKGIRDIISHHYFDINAEIVFSVCRKRIPGLKSVFQLILEEL
jgi:uncharacterized protein with HEPN domain